MLGIVRHALCRVPDALRDRLRLHVLHMLLKGFLALVRLCVLLLQSALAEALRKRILVLRHHGILLHGRLLAEHRACARLPTGALGSRVLCLYRGRRALRISNLYKPTVCAGADHRALFFLLFLRRRRCIDKSPHLALLIGIPVLLEQFLHFCFLFACHHRPSLV